MMVTCIFCGFVSGKVTSHKGGLPFQMLHETDQTLSFLSIDSSPVGGQVLVIPKTHHERIETIPLGLLRELIGHVQLISKAMGKMHSGCNILLNDGEEAGQCVFHTHFHIIPREANDGAKIAVWGHRRLTEKEYLEVTTQVKEKIEITKKEGNGG